MGTEIYVHDQCLQQGEDEENNNFMVVDRTKTVVVIFDFQGPLIFINAKLFQAKFKKTIMKRIQMALDYCRANYTAGKIGVIFDCGSMTYIDRKGVETLIELNQELAELDDLNQIQLLLTNLNHTCYKMMEHCQLFDTFSYDHCFMSNHDGYVFITTNNNCDTNL